MQALTNTLSKAGRGKPCPSCCGLLVQLAMVSAILHTTAAAQVGLLPVPVLQNVQVEGQTSFDPGSQRYTYTLTVRNPGTNTGEIWHIGLDMTTPIPKAFGVPAFDSSGLTVSVGASGLKPFDQELADLQPLLLPPGINVIPFGQGVPSGWSGGLRRDGFSSFSSHAGANNIHPGSSLGGFELISRGMPTIRKMQVEPYWIFVSKGDPTPEEEAAVRAVEQSIIFHTSTLGPSALTPGSFGHWDQVRDDLNQAIQLGWVPDQTLATALVTQLASARQALDAGDGTLAKTRLDALIQTISQSTQAQRRREVADLVLLNAQRLKESTRDTPVRVEPKLQLAPQSSTLPLGSLYTLTGTVVNLGDPANPPIPGFDLGFQFGVRLEY